MLTIELETILGETESVCPECLARVPAVRIARGEDVYLKKVCPEHGLFRTVIWRGQPAFASWVRAKTSNYPARPFTGVNRGCPFDCGLCPDHRQQSCCVLLEITRRCDLRCAFCFADAGGQKATDPDLVMIESQYRQLMDTAGRVNIQLSGGEPCLRDDLPEIAALGRAVGFTFIQVNTNGLRLARDPDYVRRLKEAGVSTIFLQFDGTRDDIHAQMRGRKLLMHKIAAIEHCAAQQLGVVLVPTVVPGINADNLGDILRFALQHQPAVRGVHFQPVSYFGRYPRPPTDADRITLPEIITALESQTAGLVQREDFQPAGAENALCSFNGNFVTMPDGALRPLTRKKTESSCCSQPECADEGLARARDFVAKNWAAPVAAPPLEGPGFGEWDVFIERARTHALCISGMAFQDAWTLDLERLRDCHIHVADPGGASIPFCAYNLTDRRGRALYRNAQTVAA
jgi:uncharacterized radical SAM superfamily Fe-S cluster-containing enzyme